MFYKILYGLVDVSLTLILSATSICGHSMRFVTPFARTDTYQHSFLPSTIKLWDSLPDSLVELVNSKKIYHYTYSLKLIMYNYPYAYTLF